MFRRYWSGLPKDASFPSDLKGLGYHVNDEDEVRSIENPDYYFKFFLDRNERINQRQRFAFDLAMGDIIHERLQGEGLKKTPLPLGTPCSEKHVPIFMDPDLKTKSRIVVFVGEVSKSLGVLAGRVAGGAGGINKGSMVSVVRELRTQRGTANDETPPGIVLANVGELYWWPEGRRALTNGARYAIPLPSLVHAGRKFVPELNRIPGLETPEDHVRYIFDKVLPSHAGDEAVVDVVVIGDTCEIVEKFLDEEKNWQVWGPRLSSLLLIDTICEAKDLTNDLFKDFLAKRSRCYLRSQDAVEMPLAPPAGNPSLCIQPLGAPCYSSSEPNYTECVLITALRQCLSYLQRNALSLEAENEPITVMPRPDEEQQQREQQPDEMTAEAWDKMDDSEKPAVEVVDPEILERQRKQDEMWKQYEETGQAVDPNLET